MQTRIHWNFMITAIASVGAVFVAGAGVCTYGAMAPGSQLFGKTIVAGRDAAEFFPGPGAHLERYARVLHGAEINSTF